MIRIPPFPRSSWERGDQGSLDFNQVVRKHVSLYGSWSWVTEDMQQAIRLVADGQVDRDCLISSRVALEEAAVAFEQQASGTALKVMVLP